MAKVSAAHCIESKRQTQVLWHHTNAPYATLFNSLPSFLLFLYSDRHYAGCRGERRAQAVRCDYRRKRHQRHRRSSGRHDSAFGRLFFLLRICRKYFVGFLAGLEHGPPPASSYITNNTTTHYLPQSPSPLSRTITATTVLLSLLVAWRYIGPP